MTHPCHSNQFNAVQAILFDAYGTLVDITAKRGPFRRLLQIGERQGRPSTAADAVTLMTTPMGIHEAAQRLGVQLTKEERARLEANLSTELASIRLFEDTLATLRALKARGYRLGLCSNLAADYAASLTTLLSSHLDVYVWSFDVGAIKPDPRIYAHSCQVLGCAPSEVLMVGDTYTADVAGPRAYGMQAIHLDRRRRSPTDDALTSLSDLLPILGVA
jgi:HAD superfamily hydrolase (TIGR01549 family)